MAVGPADFTQFTDAFRRENRSSGFLDPTDLSSDWQVGTKQAKAYSQQFDQRQNDSSAAPMLGRPETWMSTSGAGALFGDVQAQNEDLSRFAGDTLNAMSEVKARRREADAQTAAANTRARGSTTGAVVSAVGGVAAAAVGALI